jgi:tetratricopeptide (TPR) repeat protein
MSKKTKNAKPSAPAVEPKTTAKIPDMAMLGGILVLTFLVFSNTLSAGFVNWDDHGYLWLNPMVKPLGSVDLAQIFTGHTHGNYSPLVILTYCFEHTFDTIVKPGEMAVENFQPFLYHLDNVLLHLGATAMAFFFLRALGLKGWGLALATALFGMHPMRSESVAWVTERKDVLYGLFYIAALHSYWKFAQNGQTRHYLFTLLFGLLALFSKIQAVSLPLSMLALDWLAGRDWKSLKVWLEKAPFFALSLVFGLVGIHFLGEAEGLKDTGYPMTERFFFATASLWNYLQKFVMPVGLSAYYPYPKTGELPGWFYFTPLLLVALVWWIWRSRKTNPALVFGFVFFLVNIMFVLQFKGAGKAFMVDRFTYIPYLGLFYILGKTYADIESGERARSLRSLLPYLAAGFVAVCAVLTFIQNTHWKSSVALWENNTAKHPNDPLGWSNLGLAYDDLEEFEKSAQAYAQSIKVDPDYFDANFNLAVASNKLKRYDDAIRMFTRATEIKPEFAESWYGRAQVYLTKGDYPKAIADIEKYGQLAPKTEAHRVQATLGMAYASAGQHERALEAFDKAIQAKPDPDHYFRKGNSLAPLGRMNEAIEAYDAALKLKPDFADAVNNKGNAYASMNKFPEALAAFDKAIQLKPEAANYRFNRGMAKNSSGDRTGACADWQQALQMGYAPAQGLLGQFCK